MRPKMSGKWFGVSTKSLQHERLIWVETKLHYKNSKMKAKKIARRYPMNGEWRVTGSHMSFSINFRSHFALNELVTNKLKTPKIATKPASN